MTMDSSRGIRFWRHLVLLVSLLVVSIVGGMRTCRAREAPLPLPTSARSRRAPERHGLSLDFYARTCPAVDQIVANVTAARFRDTPAAGPAVLRLFHHDCFVEMDRRWMYAENRASEEYIEDVSTFLRVTEQYSLKREDTWISCPCCYCENLKSFTNLTQIQTHLIRTGFMKGYAYWTNHGEDQIVDEGSANMDEGNDMTDTVNSTPLEQTHGDVCTSQEDVSQDNTSSHDDNELDQMI